MDRTELDAVVSFLMVHHPIPALPVVCGRGEGQAYEEAVASSHDLLANGIRFQMLHATNVSRAAVDASRDAKEALLAKLQADMSAIVGPLSGTLTDSQVESCYALFCETARGYQAQYPGSPDLRLRDMASVCRSDLVHAQTLAHVRAREGMFESSDDSEPLACGALSSYAELIRAAVEQQMAVQRSSLHPSTDDLAA
jgi:hypothetical protein